jgi:hypothetical protein
MLILFPASVSTLYMPRQDEGMCREFEYDVHTRALQRKLCLSLEQLLSKHLCGWLPVGPLDHHSSRSCFWTDRAGFLFSRGTSHLFAHCRGNCLDSIQWRPL